MYRYSHGFLASRIWLNQISSSLQYGSLHKPTQLIYKYLEIISFVRNMFHVKHLSQFDWKISIQECKVCKQSQLSRAVLIKLKRPSPIDIRGDTFHVKHIAYSTEPYPENVRTISGIAYYSENPCSDKLFYLRHLLSLTDSYCEKLPSHHRTFVWLGKDYWSARLYMKHLLPFGWTLPRKIWN